MTQRSRNRCSEGLTRRGWSGTLSGVRTRNAAAFDRNTEAFERFVAASDRHMAALDRLIAASDRQGQAFDRHAAAFDSQAAAFDRQAEAFAANRDVLRSLAAEIRAHTEKMERQGEATLGAMVDLADEIRSWREADGG